MSTILRHTKGQIHKYEEYHIKILHKFYLCCMLLITRNMHFEQLMVEDKIKNVSKLHEKYVWLLFIKLLIQKGAKRNNPNLV